MLTKIVSYIFVKREGNVVIKSAQNSMKCRELAGICKLDTLLKGYILENYLPKNITFIAHLTPKVKNKSRDIKQCFYYF